MYYIAICEICGCEKVFVSLQRISQIIANRIFALHLCDTQKYRSFLPLLRESHISVQLITNAKYRIVKNIIMDGREKLIKIMQAEGLNAKQFAAEVGIQAGTISNIINGRNNASNDVVQKVLRRFENISADWMMLDRGPMYRPVPAAPVGEQTTPTLFDSLPAEPAMVSPTPEQQPAGTTTVTVSASPVASPTAPPVITTTAATTLPERTTALPRRTPATTTNTDTANAPQHTTQTANRQELTILQNNHNNTPPAKQIEKIVVFYSDGTYEDFCH